VIEVLEELQAVLKKHHAAIYVSSSNREDMELHALIQGKHEKIDMGHCICVGHVLQVIDKIE